MRAHYPKQPIGSISALSRALDVEEDLLTHIGANVSTFYRPGPPQPKKDGTLRITHNAAPELKGIHRKINKRLLQEVQYPDYLHGSIRVINDPRSIKTNAALHTNQKTILCEDVAGFFDATTPALVRKVWQHLFCFPPTVAELLTKLCTHDGFLPQGWRCSSYLANLVLWEDEDRLVRNLRCRGFTYSRYVDDMTISAPRFLSRADKSWVVQSLISTLARNGYRLKRGKHEILKAAGTMKVNGQIVNGKRPTLSTKYRNNVRWNVYALQKMHALDASSEEYRSRWESCSGKAIRVASYHERTGQKLLDQLSAIAPQ
ncbi:MAG: RNA-directed DNA polymerase [Xanthomonadales bacterium]|nr:RNA-directed DNA polymerase [Xanthomonadales bacterium]